MKPIIVANWKMNPLTKEEAKNIFISVRDGVKNVEGVETVIAAPFIYLSFLNQYKEGVLKLCGQDSFWEEKGAFTGEISPQMLEDSGAEYIILGHSERRKYLGETDEMINKKLKKVLEGSLSPILCVGDKNRDSKDDVKEIDFQLEKALDRLEDADLSKLTVAYEPVWAISTTKGGAAATLDDVKEGVSYVKNVLNGLLKEDKVKKIRIIYGGSVNSQNISGFIKAGIGGGLVGAASLKPEEFISIIKNAAAG